MGNPAGVKSSRFQVERKEYPSTGTWDLEPALMGNNWKEVQAYDTVTPLKTKGWRLSQHGTRY